MNEENEHDQSRRKRNREKLKITGKRFESGQRSRHVVMYDRAPMGNSLYNFYFKRPPYTQRFLFRSDLKYSTIQNKCTVNKIDILKYRNNKCK